MIERLSDRKTLMSVRELAKGITYMEHLLNGWKPPLPIRRMSKKACDFIRKQWRIIVDGEDIPPPIKNFKDMGFPEPVLKKLKAKIWKDLSFCVLLIMIALQEEVMMPIAPGEGPFGLIICPSRELARQTDEVMEQFLEPMREFDYPELRPLLCIGGVDMK
ncbi:DEAD-box ATP-dependent RNA helicase 35 [Forsythia ovata]|uniref:DEAD-box ATP-dependent RNA helicase 35 n=1 Tax=Forsythia ovata TaxID=205694 RepID=A0ABD1WYZ3_9LAMI